MLNIKVITPIKTYEDVRNEVEANEGIFTFDMRLLREVHGAKRIGTHVNSEISRQLASRGLSHQPKNLPNRQGRSVRVFKQNSPVASVIGAVRTVKRQNDAVIRKAALANTRSTE